MKKQLSKWLNNFWYDRQAPWYGKWMSYLYTLGLIWNTKRQMLQQPRKSLLPVVIIGNLTVGGTGKTPLVIEITKKLQAEGIRVGIITRGYQSKILKFPYLVQANDSAELVGDEAALIAQKTLQPVVISPQRNLAIEFLYQHQLCDIVLSDDGLQHYAMPRNLELLIVDGERGFGNEQLLPIGPLREPLSRLNKVDFILTNGAMNNRLSTLLNSYIDKSFSFSLLPQKIYSLHTSSVCFEKLKGPFAAFAGIGNPKRFFNHLKNLNLDIECYPFPDHHHFSKQDFNIAEDAIIMTEKDAIKCLNYKSKPIFVLPVEANLSDAFWSLFLNKIRELIS